MTYRDNTREDGAELDPRLEALTQRMDAVDRRQAAAAEAGFVHGFTVAYELARRGVDEGAALTAVRLALARNRGPLN